MIAALLRGAIDVFDGAARFCEALNRVHVEQRSGFSEYEAGDYLAAGGRMECDGPDASDTPYFRWTPAAETDSAAPADFPAAGSAESPKLRGITDYPDSELVLIAAYFALSPENFGPDWRAEFAAACRDRAAHFEAVEADANKPFAAETGHCGLTHAAETFPQHTKQSKQ